MELRSVEPEPNLDASPGASEDNAAAPGEGRHIAWTQLRRLGATIYPTLSPFGRPTTFAGGSKFLIVGTFGAEVLLFGYDQTLVAQLSTGSGSVGPVTSLALSRDESHVVAGFGLGAVCVFDLEAPPVSAPKLLTLVPPMPVGRAARSVQESHTHGIPIVGCGFVGRSRRSFVSVDAAGVVVVHRYHRVLLEYTTQSRRVLGSYDRAAPILSTSILDSYVALLTQHLLLVVNIDAGGSAPVATEILSVPRTRDTDEQPSGHGIVKMRSSPPSKVQLVYTWGRQLKLVDLEPAGVGISRGYTHSSSIVQVEWMLDLLVLLGNKEISFVNKDAVVVDTGTLANQPIKFAVVGTTLFALGKYEFSVGQLANWADRLLWLVNSGEPANAIRLALQFYNEEGNLSVFGLPASQPARQASIRQALPNFVLTAIKFSASYDVEALKTLLPAAAKAAVIAEVDLFEQILDILDEQWSHNLFLRSLVPFVLDRQLKSLPPAVFKELVMLDTDPRLFYLLDTSMLDLDFAFKLCAKQPERLAQVRIYLENQALHDYTSALHDADHVFDYLASTLSSRVYPTGENAEDATGKLQIYATLFLDDADHALLRELLDLNESAFYRALNEAFEDPWLNDSTDISRQTIVGLLIHLNAERRPSSPLPDKDLSLFIARNYAKYQQFLVLPDTLLSHVVKELCLNGSGEETQLALLSLLSSYKPHDIATFIDQLVQARYTLVLEHVLLQRHRLLDLVKLKLQLEDYTNFWTVLNEVVAENRAEAVAFVIRHLAKLTELDTRELSRLTVRHSVEEVWHELAHVGDHKLAFLDACFEEISVQGGKLPPMDTRVAYIELLLEADDSQAEKPQTETRETPSKSVEHPDRLMYVLRHYFPGPQDIDLRLVVDALISHDRIDALALLLCWNKRHSEAMIYVLNHIAHLPAAEAAYYIDIAADICAEVGETDKEESQGLWQRLLETMVENKLDAELRRVLNTMADSNTADVAGVATYLLSTHSSYEPAPRLVGQLYSDMVRRERALRCFYDIALNDGYQELLEVIKARARGWMVPVDGECETCGHKIVGLGIDAAQVYKAWSQHSAGNSAGTASEQRKSNDSMDDEALLLFQCGHSYHLACLRRMTSKRSCIVCEP